MDASVTKLLAEGGDAEAQYRLAGMYESMHGRISRLRIGIEGPPSRNTLEHCMTYSALPKMATMMRSTVWVSCTRTARGIARRC